MSTIRVEVQSDPQKTPEQKPKPGRFTLLVGRLLDAYYEGYLMESMPCSEYCKRVVDPEKPNKVFNECMAQCAFAQSFAEWHKHH